MPRYFFHFDSEVYAADPDGAEFPSFEDAQRYARQIAWELAKNAPAHLVARSCLRVTDEQSQEVLTIPLQEAIEPPSVPSRRNHGLLVF